MSADFRLTQSHFEALLRRHFGNLGEPVIDHSRSGFGAFLATYGLTCGELRVERGEASDLLETTLRKRDEARRVPLSARHQGMRWTPERLEEAFAEHAGDVLPHLSTLEATA